MLCVCKCKRTAMNDSHFEVFHKGKHCPDCGERFNSIEQPVIGIWVELEGGSLGLYGGDWISLAELKRLLGKV